MKTNRIFQIALLSILTACSQQVDEETNDLTYTAIKKVGSGSAQTMNVSLDSTWSPNPNQFLVEYWVEWDSYIREGKWGRASDVSITTETPTGDQTLDPELIPWSCSVSPNRKEVSFSIHLTMEMNVSYEFVEGKWYHVACQYDGDEGKLYVGGKMIKSAKMFGGVSRTPGMNLVVSRQLRTKADAGTYSLRNVRISSKSRYTTEFAPSWNSEVDEDVVALYKFDEGTGQAANDSSGKSPSIEFSPSESFVWVTSQR